MTAILPPSADDGARTESVSDAVKRLHARVTSERQFMIPQQVCDDIRTVLARLAAPAIPAARGEEAEEAALALQQATTLAVSLFNQHFRFVDEPYVSRRVEWKPLPDLRGVISQIDNMTTALSRAPTLPPGGDATEAQPCAAEAMREALATECEREHMIGVAQHVREGLALNIPVEIVLRAMRRVATPPVQPKPRDPCENAYGAAKALTDRPVGAGSVTAGPRDRGAMGETEVERIARAVYQDRPMTATSPALVQSTGLPQGAAIPYDTFIAMGGSDSGVRRIIRIALAMPGLPAAEQKGGE